MTNHLNEYKKALAIINILEKNGYECEFVGGCVRDKCLGKEVNDYDLVTNASTEEILEVYKGIKVSIDEVGKNFGVLIINGIEVAQYRTETYEKVSKPTIKLTSSKKEDSSRRDFTINSLYMNKDGEITDYHNGLKHLKEKIIESVGNPEDRFKEDPSRILRALYLKSKLGFNLSLNLKNSIKENAGLVCKVPKELVGKIILKTISSGKLSEFMKDAMDLGLLKYVFTEFEHLNGLVQSPVYHKYDAWNHTLVVLRSAEQKYPGDVAFILSALYHDVAKGLSGVRGINKLGYPNDIGHEEVGSAIAFEKMLDYGFGKPIAREVSFYVRYHGIRLDKNSKLKSYVKLLRKMSNEYKNKNDLKNGLIRLVDLIDCDADGFNEDLKIEIKEYIPYLKRGLNEALNSHMFYINELPVNGQDIMIITGKRGPVVGEILEMLLFNNITNREQALKILESKRN